MKVSLAIPTTQCRSEDEKNTDNLLELSKWCLGLHWNRNERYCGKSRSSSERKHIISVGAIRISRELVEGSRGMLLSLEKCAWLIGWWQYTSRKNMWSTIRWTTHTLCGRNSLPSHFAKKTKINYINSVPKLSLNYSWVMPWTKGKIRLEICSLWTLRILRIISHQKSTCKDFMRHMWKYEDCMTTTQTPCEKWLHPAEKTSS